MKEKKKKNHRSPTHTDIHKNYLDSGSRQKLTELKEKFRKSTNSDAVDQLATS